MKRPVALHIEAYFFDIRGLGRDTSGAACIVPIGDDKQEIDVGLVGEGGEEVGEIFLWLLLWIGVPYRNDGDVWRGWGRGWGLFKVYER